jgi:hypothetical protein
MANARSAQVTLILIRSKKNVWRKHAERGRHLEEEASASSVQITHILMRVAKVVCQIHVQAVNM